MERWEGKKWDNSRRHGEMILKKRKELKNNK